MNTGVHFFFFLIRNTRGTQRTSENFTECYITAESIVIFHCSLHLVDGLLPTLNRSVYARVIKVVLPHLQPLVHGTLHWFVVGIMVSSQDFLLKENR